MEILGYILSIFMGFTLGLLGGGGSILTVPVLVYVFGIDPVLATAYSLFVVGGTALSGSFRKYREGLVNWNMALIFGIPSLLAVFLTRYLMIPAIPDHLFTLMEIEFTKDVAIMVFFGMVMLIASYSMIRNGRKIDPPKIKKPRISLVIAEGLVVGVVTGLVGAGGGFLIVPALVLLVGMPMKEAVGTSLVIIAIKSLLGFTGDIASGQMIDWSFLLVFTGFAMAGMAVGVYATRFISPGNLKKAFGIFVLIMGILIMVGEVT